jgi:hypothetical protein
MAGGTGDETGRRGGADSGAGGLRGATKPEVIPQPKLIGWQTMNGETPNSRERERADLICQAKSRIGVFTDTVGWLGCMAASGYLPIYEPARR